jgi:16S rRNA (uracil1498-N3)-methyltransferase
MGTPTVYLDPVATVIPSSSPWYHYLTRSVRVRVGDALHLLDGRGGLREARVAAVDREGLTAEVLAERAACQHEPALVLCVALIPANRWDWLVEKATELGADAIQPLLTARTQVRDPGQDLPDRLERWTRKAMDAVRQCGRPDVPEIRPPQALESLLREHELPDRPVSRLLLSPRAEPGALSGLPARGELHLLVGPEGGWSPGEERLLQASGAVPLNLGTTVLRVETAALAALAVVRFPLRR